MSLSLPVPLCACTCVPISVRNSLLVFMCRVKSLPTPYSVSTCLHQFACLCVCDTPSGCKCLAPPPIRSPFFFDSDTPDLTPGDPRGAHQTGMVGWVKVDVVDPALWCMWMKSVCVCVCKGGVVCFGLGNCLGLSLSLSGSVSVSLFPAMARINEVSPAVVLRSQAQVTLTVPYRAEYQETRMGMGWGWGWGFGWSKNQFRRGGLLA